MNALTKHKRADIPPFLLNVLPGGKYHDMAVQWRDGATLQVTWAKLNGDWRDFLGGHCFGPFAAQHDGDVLEWRIKPAPKLRLVDLSKLPKGAMVTWTPSDSIFEFRGVMDDRFVRVEGAAEGSFSAVTATDLRIAPSPWIGNPEGCDSCPVPEGLRYEVMFRVAWLGYKTMTNEQQANFSWRNDEVESDIIFFRILGLAPGWTDDTEAAK